jgi:NADP-reducing hydrogenase subunit HndB
MEKKVRSPEELNALRETAKAEIDLRGGTKDVAILVHMGTCGIAAGARDVLTQLAQELAERHVDNVTLRQSGCAGLCDQEPMMTVTDQAGGEFHYARLDKKKVHEIVREHVLGGKPVRDYMIRT